jgi:transcription elongation GreA/GreB family factor
MAIAARTPTIQYAKRRLRQIDGRIRHLSKRMEAAEVVDPEAARSELRAARVYFGATVLYSNASGVEREVSIVGIDEVDLERNHVSWVSPLGRALMRSAEGDSVVLEAPVGKEPLTVLEVRYERIDVEPFREPPGSYAAANSPRANRCLECDGRWFRVRGGARLRRLRAQLSMEISRRPLSRPRGWRLQLPRSLRQEESTT